MAGRLESVARGFQSRDSGTGSLQASGGSLLN
jgi:hypothetical protein